VTASGNGSSRVWDTATGEPITPFVHLDCLLEFTAFNREGTRFVTAGGNPPENEEGLARVWNARTGKPITPILRHRNVIQSAAFSPYGTWLITQARDEAKIWDVQTGAPAELAVKFRSQPNSLAFSRDGRVLAVCTGTSSPRAEASEGTRGPGAGSFETRLFDVHTGQPVMPALAMSNAVTRMEFSPDGRWLLTFAWDASHHRWNSEPFYAGSVGIWKVATGAPLTPAPESIAVSPTVVFTRDSRHLLVTSFTAPPIAWDLSDGRQLSGADWRALLLHPDTMSPEGRRFAVIDGRLIRVCEAGTGVWLTPPLQCRKQPNFGALRFSPDGNLLWRRSVSVRSCGRFPKRLGPSRR
jgi:WD40 repeat protein